MLHRAWQDARDEAAELSRPALLHRALQWRANLRPALLCTADGARALGLATAAAQREYRLTVHDEQALAAWIMLQGRLAEMATGEGKTLATALAAATAALAGLQVHVMTANDYLVARDRQHLQPLFHALGLSCADVVQASPREDRWNAYRQDIVYVTARELVFDHLRDHQQHSADRDPRVLRARAMAGGLPEPGRMAPAQLPNEPLVPRLQQALVDEADSILLDEASVPFILSMPAGEIMAEPLKVARELALRLPAQAYAVQVRQHSARLLPLAEAELQRTVVPGHAIWPLRLARELVRAALVAEHALVKGRDYAVLDGAIALVDDVTGRKADGRQWNHPLQAMVELKEGLEPTPPRVTAARITYQRLFPRYERLGGSSGTLRESAGELRALYGCAVSTVPRVRPSQLCWMGTRLFARGAQRDIACVERIRELRQAGRPVLVGTQSVRASLELSQRLLLAGIEHAVLNAVQDADESRLIARAGEPGRVTVTTNMAGRGTDIVLQPRSRAAGGLHVILALCNRSRRIDRQLAGRAARQGDPGSAEAMLSLDDPAMSMWTPGQRVWRLLMPLLPAAAMQACAQRRSEWRERLHRRDLAFLDDEQSRQLAFTGAPE